MESFGWNRYRILEGINTEYSREQRENNGGYRWRILEGI